MKTILATVLIGIGLMGTVSAQIAIRQVYVDVAGPETILLNDFVVIVTEDGDIPIRLRTDVAPSTVAGFLELVEAGAFNDNLIHRSEPGYAIYGGGFRFFEQIGPVAISGLRPVLREGNMANRRGTMALVQFPDDPPGDTTRWRINVSDAQAQRDAVYGTVQVIGEVMEGGMQAVESINALPVVDFDGELSSLPVTEMPGEEFDLGLLVVSPGIASLSNVSIVAQVPEDIVSASLSPSGRELTLTPVPGQTGSSDIALHYHGGGRDLFTTLRVVVVPLDFFGRPPGGVVDETFWFGTFNVHDFNPATRLGWIWHGEHGWFYVAGKGYREGIWTWDHIQQEWLWTRRDLYPFSWGHDRQAWTYYYRGGTPAGRHFYDYEEEAWELVKPE